MRTIRASEIGLFLYCRRAWWYNNQGMESQNQPEMSAGTEYHRRHGRQVFLAGILRLAGWALLLAALILAAIVLTNFFYG
jgi:CRISPR/Cas system-associated exonuclease Cas4 (RecB family)